MTVGKDVQKSRQEQTENHVHLMVKITGKEIEHNPTTGCEV